MQMLVAQFSRLNLHAALLYVKYSAMHYAW